MTYVLASDADRFLGVMLGAGLGDALGWPHEQRASRVGKTPAAHRLEMHDWIKRSGGKFQAHEELISAGAYSDDTQLLMAVARSRLAGRDWWQRLARSELPFWTLYQRGGGGASLRATRSLLKGVLPWEGNAADRGRYFEAGGNGVAMRIAPHVLMHARDVDFHGAATDIVADGVLTHGHPRALVGALVYGFALWTALQKRQTLGFGELVERVSVHVPQWAALPNISEYWPTWQRLVPPHSAFHQDWAIAVHEILDGMNIVRRGLSTGALAFDEETLRDLGCFDKSVNGAGTVAALSSIFLASKHAASPFEGVARAALAYGADTDTIASMTGALGGAIAGTDWLAQAIPQLQDHRYLHELGRRLANPLKTYASPPTRVKQSDLNRFVAALKADAPRVELPIGGTAMVSRHHGIRTKSDRLEIGAWQLETDFGQTLVVKSLSVLKPERRPSVASRVENEHKQARQKSAPLLDGGVDSSVANGSSEGLHATFAGISLPVHDLDLSREFYTVLLGIEISRETAGRVQLGSTLILQQDSDVVPGAKSGLIYISVPDVKRCREQISDRLGLPVSSISEKGGRRAFLCRDPDGYALEIFQK